MTVITMVSYMISNGKTSEMNHPLPIGHAITSVDGEWDSDEQDRERRTGPMARGHVIYADHYPDQGWYYGVVFELSKVWVHIHDYELDSDDYIY